MKSEEKKLNEQDDHLFHQLSKLSTIKQRHISVLLTLIMSGLLVAATIFIIVELLRQNMIIQTVLIFIIGSVATKTIYGKSLKGILFIMIGKNMPAIFLNRNDKKIAQDNKSKIRAKLARLSEHEIRVFKENVDPFEEGIFDSVFDCLPHKIHVLMMDEEQTVMSAHFLRSLMTNQKSGSKIIIL